MGRSTVHYADSNTNNILKALHNKLRPAGTPVQRVEYIIELLLLRIFEVKLKREDEFKKFRKLFDQDSGNEEKLFYHLQTLSSENILPVFNTMFFPFYANILQEARKVLQGNLNTKVQDQLVLIQEVFANSNFTNNVQSGNLGDIIQLVSEIDEDRLLNTDLLGDAIESALSESGGTKDIGLFRTPDHIRHFMVGLLAPTMRDMIFDPACGTGGFLFNAFEYVTEAVKAQYSSVYEESRFPGQKSHPELQVWFEAYFRQHPAEMPSIEQSTQFYRSGIFGIEYLGMIRKMAAVNFYIRGLNPHNIEQGDSLAKFGLDYANSKSIVLANPPFGAERDQKAYPNVWEEYSAESETTILFVKLMLDALKEGGRCAVVVSEGFLTWEQNSAKALRKMLLEDANLQAVIGLPQGVFVSKTGQCPKTSILLFQKGTPTQHVWFYTVENDGYTKGTNRTPIAGCQLVEALELYHRYVKDGKLPPETSHSFSIAVDWLKVVDPRVKAKIRQEVTAKLTLQRDEAKEKLIEKLDDRLQKAQTAKPGTALSKFDQTAYQAELWKFETTWKQKIQNEIGKQIDKAHIYSFNPTTYRSNLSASQLQAWEQVVQAHQPDRNGHSLDRHYHLLRTAALPNAIKQIAAFDPQNAIEADIVREYLTQIDPTERLKYPELAKIDAIFKSGATYPLMKLADYLLLNTKKIKPANELDCNYRVLGVSNETGIFLNEHLKPEETNQSYYVVEKNQICYNPYRINVGSIGLNEFDYDNQIISGAYVVFGTDTAKLHPKYLLALFRHSKFLEYVNAKASGGVRMNFTFEQLGEWQIPLPPLDKQQEIVEQVQKQRAIVEGANKIIENWDLIDDNIFNGFEIKELGSIIEFVSSGSTPLGGEINYVKEGTLFIRSQNVMTGYCDFSDAVYIPESIHLQMKRTHVKFQDVFLNIRHYWK